MSGCPQVIDWHVLALTGALLNVDGGGLPVSLWRVTSAAVNEAAAEPHEESPAEELFESAWGRWATTGCV